MESLKREWQVHAYRIFYFARLPPAGSDVLIVHLANRLLRTPGGDARLLHEYVLCDAERVPDTEAIR